MMKKYDVDLVWEAPPSLNPETVNLVHKFANLGPNTDTEELRLLDFGCGQGRYMEAYAHLIPKKNIVGADVLVQDLHIAHQKGFQCIKLDENGDCLPFADATFNVVFSSNVIEHIARKQYLVYLREIHRVLTDGGRFVVSTPNYPIKRFYDIKKAQETALTRYYLFDDPTHINKLTFWQLEKDLKAVFSDVQLIGSGFHFLERWFKRLRGPRAKRVLRYFADKATGYCIK